MCADNRNGECPMHGPLHSLRRLVGTSSSAAPVAPPDVPDWLRDLPREVRLPDRYMTFVFFSFPSLYKLYERRAAVCSKQRLIIRKMRSSFYSESRSVLLYTVSAVSLLIL